MSKESLNQSIKGPKGGPGNVNYTELVSWLTNELNGLYEMDESVNKTLSSSESSTFMIELSSFLKELGIINVEYRYWYLCSFKTLRLFFSRLSSYKVH